MPVSPNTENYMYGKGNLYFKPEGETGFMHLGNCPAFAINVELEKAEHYSSMAGTKEKDLSKVTQKTAKSSITMEEFSAENLNLAFMGSGVTTTEQTTTAIDAQEITVVEGRYVEISSGDVRLSNVTVEDDATSPTTTYVEGTDYLLDLEAGMIMALPGSDLATTGTAYISADVATVNKNEVNALAESSVAGELYFVGNPDIGPNWQVRGWNVELTLGGEVPFISEDVAQMSLEAEFQADRNAHPDCPFFKATQVEASS